jgi:hypothetical protein
MVVELLELLALPLFPVPPPLTVTLPVLLFCGLLFVTFTEVSLVVAPLPYPVPLVFVAAEAEPNPIRLIIANAPTPNDSRANKALDLMRCMIFTEAPFYYSIMVMDIMCFGK